MLTSKQEAFCLALQETGSQSEAYRRAYNASRMTDETVHKRASELAKNGEVTGRLAELRASSQQRTETTVDLLDQQLKDACELARSLKNPMAMIAAVSALARLHGLNKPDKQVVEVDAGSIDYAAIDRALESGRKRMMLMRAEAEERIKQYET